MNKLRTTGMNMIEQPHGKRNVMIESRRLIYIDDAFEPYSGLRIVAEMSLLSKPVRESEEGR